MTDEKTIYGACLQALDGLGPTPEAIASTLEVLEITGTPKQCHTCPLSVYLSRQLGLPVSIDPPDILVYLRTALVRVPMPYVVLLFVERFDLGEFQKLVAAEGVKA